MGEPFNLRTETLDLAGEKGWIDESAQAGVDGRFDFKQRVFLEAVKGQKMLRGVRPTKFLARGEVQNLSPEAAVAE